MVQPLIRENLPGRGIDAIHLLPTRMKITAYNQHNGSFPPSSWSLCKVTTVYRALGAVVLIQSRAAATKLSIRMLPLRRGEPAVCLGVEQQIPRSATQNVQVPSLIAALRGMTVSGNERRGDDNCRGINPIPTNVCEPSKAWGDEML